jgi:hypothetical protein
MMLTLSTGEIGLERTETGLAFRQANQPAPGLPILAQLLKTTGPLPEMTALVGMGEDGLPYLLDLSEPGPGSILIAGDEQSGKTRLLRAILVSMCRLNRAEAVCFSLISPRPEEFTGLLTDHHCLSILAANEPAASAIVDDFYALAEQRRSGRPSTRPALVLVVDDLGSFLQYQDDEGLHRFRGLVQWGPQVGVWVIATLGWERARQVGRPAIDDFGTRLIGSLGPNRSAAWLVDCLPEGEPLAALGANHGRAPQFYVLSNGDWSGLWIPEAGYGAE